MYKGVFMKYSVLALSLLVSSSAFGMESKEETGLNKGKEKAQRIYRAVKTDVVAFPGQVKEVVLGLPTTVKDETNGWYNGLKTRVTNPEAAAREIAETCKTVATYAAYVGVPAWVVAKAFEYAKK